jgi:hypothetical protein
MMAPLPRPVSVFGALPPLGLKGAPRTLEAMAEYWKARNERWQRGHLGASIIGRECERELWLSYRWARNPGFDGRLLRLFNRGAREEEIFIQELRSTGATVYDVDPRTGRQFTFSDHNHHFGGSADGVALGIPDAKSEPHLLEFKTHSSKSFDKLSSVGVEAAKPEHFAQMQVYMNYFRLKRALYLAVNKNTDAVYAERIDFDPDVAARMIEKAKHIIEAPVPGAIRPEKSPACLFCDYKPMCHGGEGSGEKSCRTCSFSTPATGGAWWCAKHDQALNLDAQLAGCADHSLHPDLEARDGTA